MAKTSARWLALGAAFLAACSISTGGCSSEPAPASPPYAYVVFELSQSGDVIYAGGAFRKPDNAAGNKLLGHEMLLILDARDPSRPVPVEARDNGISKLVGVMGGTLVTFQDGYDEGALGGSGPLPEQDFRLKVYSLTEPRNPQLAKTVTIPGTRGIDFPAAVRLDDENVLVYVTAPSAEPFDTPVLWLVRPNAAPGTEVRGSLRVTCQAPVLVGPRIWCFMGAGAKIARALDVAPDGSLALASDAAFPALKSPSRSTLLPSGDVLVADTQAGALRVSLGGGTPSVRATGSFARSRDAIPSGARLVVQTSIDLRLVDATSLAEVSILGLPGEPYGEFAGGSSVHSFGAAGSGMFMAAMGDYGVSIFRDDGGRLERVGGYYKRFGTNWSTDDQLQEGSY